MSADSFLQGLTSPFYKVKSEAERYAKKVVKTSLVKDDRDPFQSYYVYICLGPAVDKNVEVEARRVNAELYVRYVVRETLRLVLESIMSDRAKEDIYLDDFNNLGVKSIEDYVVELTERTLIGFRREGSKLGEIDIAPDVVYAVDLQVAIPHILGKPRREPYTMVRLVKLKESTPIPRLGVCELVQDTLHIFTPTGECVK